MEIGKYENKSKQRSFQNLVSENTRIDEKNIKFHILYNFTNISDQVRNSMLRLYNNELTKIDLRRLNSEKVQNNIEQFLEYFNTYKNIFTSNKTKVKNELNKLVYINEKFIVDLIKFRTQRGSFNTSRKELAIQIDCISSSYKVLKLSKNDRPFFERILRKCKKDYENLHLGTNPAFSWMLYLLAKNNVLSDTEYDDYVIKFNKKSENFKRVAEGIRTEEIIIQKKEEKIVVKKEESKNAEIKDNKKDEIKKVENKQKPFEKIIKLDKKVEIKKEDKKEDKKEKEKKEERKDAKGEENKENININKKENIIPTKDKNKIEIIKNEKEKEKINEDKDEKNHQKQTKQLQLDIITKDNNITTEKDNLKIIINQKKDEKLCIVTNTSTKQQESINNNKELINENKVNNDKNNLNLNDKININIVNESMSFEKLNPNDKDKKISINNNTIESNNIK